MCETQGNDQVPIPQTDHLFCFTTGGQAEWLKFKAAKNLFIVAAYVRNPSWLQEEGRSEACPWANVQHAQLENTVENFKAWRFFPVFISLCVFILSHSDWITLLWTQASTSPWVVSLFKRITILWSHPQSVSFPSTIKRSLTVCLLNAGHCVSLTAAFPSWNGKWQQRALYQFHILHLTAKQSGALMDSHHSASAWLCELGVLP